MAPFSVGCIPSNDGLLPLPRMTDGVSQLTPPKLSQSSEGQTARDTGNAEAKTGSAAISLE